MATRALEPLGRLCCVDTLRRLLRDQTLPLSYGAGRGPGLRQTEGTTPGHSAPRSPQGRTALHSREMLSSQQRRFLQSDEASGHPGTLRGHGGPQAWGGSCWTWAGACPVTISAPHTSETVVWLQLMLDLGSQRP